MHRVEKNLRIPDKLNHLIEGKAIGKYSTTGRHSNAGKIRKITLSGENGRPCFCK